MPTSLDKVYGLSWSNIGIIKDANLALRKLAVCLVHWDDICGGQDAIYDFKDAWPMVAMKKLLDVVYNRVASTKTMHNITHTVSHSFMTTLGKFLSSAAVIRLAYAQCDGTKLAVFGKKIYTHAK